MITGTKVNMRRVEERDIPTVTNWLNDPGFTGPHADFPTQITELDLAKRVLGPVNVLEWTDYVIENQNREAVGWACHYIDSLNFNWHEIAYAVLPKHRKQGYATEAAQLLIDYLFMTKDIPRIQAKTNSTNDWSIKVLENANMKREGALRKAIWVKPGKWADGLIYGITREDWEKPRLLK